MVNEAKKAINELNKLGIYPSLYNVHTIKPINIKQLNAIANQYNMLFTLEEHSIIGGLYSTVCECLSNRVKIYPIGIRDTFGESGTPEELMKKYKIDKEAIVSCIVKERSI